MDKNIAIEFDGVGKQYRLGLVGTGSLQHDINRWWQTTILRKEDPYLKIGEVNDRSKKGTSDYVWALKDISFKVEQGDVVGIIGKNGAGKSTLLKLLSHITAPSVGHIRYRGRIASLLEVGTGFHPEMTARQNIYMNGSIMGMTRHEITSKLDEIVDFAGIERYLDTPVKRFSSGMTVRLGFAVAAFLEPEILVVDEVLAVGDAEFQKKAIGKMKDVSSHGGRTVLFVSHNMGSIRQLCKNGILLENGTLKQAGNVNDIVDYYLSSNNFLRTNSHVDITEDMHDKNRCMFATLEMAEFAKESATFASDEVIVVRLKVKSKKDYEELRVNIGIMDIQDSPLGTYSSDAFFSIKANEEKLLEYTIQPTNLALGTYSLAFSVGVGNIKEGETNYDVVHHVLSFDIDRLSAEKSEFFAKWERGWGTFCFKASMKEIS